MNPQLLEITNLLQDNDIIYWIDNGTLLGLMRDGELIAHDKDIDIGLWADSEEKVETLLLPILEKDGYETFELSYYKSLVFKIRLFNRDSSKMPIDLSFFRKEPGIDYVWCPQRVDIVISYPKIKAARLALKKTIPLFRDILLYRKRKIDIMPGRIKTLRHVYTWWVPHRVFSELTIHPKFGVSIPVVWEDYLTFRYGNWRIPVQNWNYSEDDGGLLKMDPDATIAKYKDRIL